VCVCARVRACARARACVCACVCVFLVICILYFEVFLNLTEIFLTQTEVFPYFFLSCKVNARAKLAETGHGPHSSTLVCICVVWLLFVLFYVLFVCKCVLPPGDNPIAVNKYIISYSGQQGTERVVWKSLDWFQRLVCLTTPFTRLDNPQVPFVLICKAVSLSGKMSHVR